MGLFVSTTKNNSHLNNSFEMRSDAAACVLGYQCRCKNLFGKARGHSVDLNLSSGQKEAEKKAIHLGSIEGLLEPFMHKKSRPSLSV